MLPSDQRIVAIILRYDSHPRTLGAREGGGGGFGQLLLPGESHLNPDNRSRMWKSVDFQSLKQHYIQSLKSQAELPSSVNVWWGVRCASL